MPISRPSVILKNRLPTARVVTEKRETASPRRYEQARQAVEDYIRREDLQPGDRLPTEEALRREFGWSRVTITRALNELAWQGRLRRVQGSGTYVAEPPSPIAAAETVPTPVRASENLRLMVGAPPFSAHDDYCAPLFAGIREEAAAHGVDITYHLHRSREGGAVPDSATVERLKAQGVLTVAWRLDDVPRVLALHEAGVPVVALAVRSRAHRLPLVCTDNYGGVRMAVQHLLDAGHRRIAYSTVNIQNSDVFERLSGFQFEMAQHGIPVDPAYLQVSNWRREPALLESWWQSMDPSPTALLLDGTDAPALLSALTNQGIRIPEDLSVVLIDQIEALRYFTPPLTVLRQPTYELGRRGLAKLIAILQGADDGSPEVLPTELVEGESVRRLSPP